MQTGGASDANHIGELNLPVLDGLGPVGGDDHSPNEYMDSNSIVPRTALLAGLIEAISIHRDKLSAFVKWILLHQGYPYVREAGYLASIYANVYTDLSLAIPFAVSETDMLLTQLLGLAPTSKLLYASDGSSVPELFWLGAKVGRAGLERVLALQVDNGVLSVPEAYKTAEQILFRNSERLYIPE